MCWSQSSLNILSVSLSEQKRDREASCCSMCVTREWCKSVRMWEREYATRELAMGTEHWLWFHCHEAALRNIICVTAAVTNVTSISLYGIADRERLLSTPIEPLQVPSLRAIVCWDWTTGIQCWGVRVGPMARTWFNSNTNMLRGMFCFGVKCECVYSPLEEDMHCALCIVHCAACDPVSHRHAVEGECKRPAKQQLRRLLYDVYVRPCDCAVCRMVVGCVFPSLFWSVPERRRSSISFLEALQFPNIPYILFNDTYILDIMIQWSTHCMAYHKVYRFCHLKVMEPMFTSCSRLQQRNQDLIIYRQQQSKQGLMFSSMTNDCATAQAVQHSENKWIKTQSLPVITYQCYRSTTVEENRWVFHIGF
jgi:hypothetical protein